MVRQALAARAPETVGPRRFTRMRSGNEQSSLAQKIILPDFYRAGIMTINPPAITPPMFDNPKNGPIYPTYE